MSYLYPYLADLKKTYPPVYGDLGDEMTGFVSGTRYEGGGYSPQVIIDESQRGRITEPHEYIHYAIDRSPNWSYMIPPQMGMLNQPKMALNYPSEMNVGLGHMYPRNLQFEEGAVRSIVPADELSQNIHNRPDVYFTPQQLEILPYLKRYLQYGPSWGSLAGNEFSGVVVDPTYRGQQVKNKDKTISSERTMTFEVDGVHYIVPTLYRGMQLRPEDAFELFKRGHLPAVGMASTQEEADKVAGERSKMLGEEKKTEFAPPKRRIKANEIKATPRGIYNREAQGRNEPEVYKWSDMVFYP